MNYQTFKQANYSFVKKVNNGYILKDNSTGNLEMFQANKNHASWGLIYKNTHLEFREQHHSPSAAPIVVLANSTTPKWSRPLRLILRRFSISSRVARVSKSITT